MDMNRFDKLLKPFPIIETPRLILRKLEKQDSADMYEYACRSETTRYLLWNPHPSIAYTKSYLNMVQKMYRTGGYYDWAVIEKESGRMIGTCGFARLDERHSIGEIGYVLNKAFHHKGYATEAASAVIEFGFRKLGLNRIEGRYMAENEASRRVMEHCGMTYEGTLRQLMLVRGSYRDIGLCALLKSDYTEMQSATSAKEGYHQNVRSN